MLVWVSPRVIPYFWSMLFLAVIEWSPKWVEIIKNGQGKIKQKNISQNYQNDWQSLFKKKRKDIFLTVFTSVDAKLSPLFTARCFAALLLILPLSGKLGLSTEEELSLLLNAWIKKKEKKKKKKKIYSWHNIRKRNIFKKVWM